MKSFRTEERSTQRPEIKLRTSQLKQATCLIKKEASIACRKKKSFEYSSNDFFMFNTFLILMDQFVQTYLPCQTQDLGRSSIQYQNHNFLARCCLRRYSDNSL